MKGKTTWFVLKRIFIFKTGLLASLIGLTGLTGIIVFQLPKMKTIWWYLVLGLFYLILFSIGFFSMTIALRGKTKDIDDF
jgi:hypothetical protein